VCILTKKKVPYLIRATDNAEENKFHFIEEAYVYRIMYGEATLERGRIRDYFSCCRSILIIVSENLFVMVRWINTRKE